MSAMPQQLDLEEAIGAFSYAQLSRDDEVTARADAVLIRSHVEDIAKKGIEIGRALNRQKERMAHGLFMAWVRDECGMSHSGASRMMKVAREIGEKFHRVELCNDIGMKALEILVSDTTPQEVRDRVEELLVDGERVTVARIRQMKSEAISAQTAIEGLTARNNDLAERKVPPRPQLVDVEAIRQEAVSEVEARLTKRMNELADVNVSLMKQLEEARATPPAPEEGNVHHADFGGGDDEDDELGSDPSSWGPDRSSGAFAGLMESAVKAKFTPAEFWRRIGKTGEHATIIRKSILHVNAITAALIKEFEK